ncbi:MAG: pyrroloquinoline quinone precursor peptide PqqA [Rhodovarius sp.]|nr:pyrroloquinoline quinone precursor peptide PqqA [Rhodovarius sp.]
MEPAPVGGNTMAWKTPKIVEVSLALEINSYACAEIG